MLGWSMCSPSRRVCNKAPHPPLFIPTIGHNYIGTEHILLGLLREGEGVAARVLETLGADPAKIRTQVIRMVGESQETVGSTVGGGASGSNKTPTLEEYGTNLTTLAEEVHSGWCWNVLVFHSTHTQTNYRASWIPLWAVKRRLSV